MHVGVDATCWANARGYGRFTREIVPVMASLAPADRFTCFVDASQAGRFDLTMPNVEVAPVTLGSSPTTAAAADGRRAIGDMLRLTRAVGRAGLDVFFSPSVYTYFPLPPGLRAVVTIHDAIAERFPQLTLPSRRARLFWRMKVALAIRQARLVLTVSDFAAGDLARVLRIDRTRIRVALEAPADVYRLPPDDDGIRTVMAQVGLPAGSRWFTYVGGFNPHKNVDLLVRAHAALARELGKGAPHLVLVGPVKEDVFFSALPRIRKTIADADTGHLVHWAGFLPDEDLRLLHAGALALALPSACEGFGLPAVEAAAAGSPIVATTESPLPQILADAGLFVEPGDVSALITALRAMASDEPARQRMALNAVERAGQLTWDRAARSALAALYEAAGESPAAVRREPSRGARPERSRGTA